MKREEKVTLLMDQMSEAYADPEVKKNPELAQSILNSAKELEKNGNVDLVSTRLCKKIWLSDIGNNNKIPKAALVLYNQCKGKEMKYDGIATAAIMSGFWF
ncbi:bacteriocin immunity protein [Companilactobacillus kimchiensis]|uniref:Bacteriocin immunity protein n=1 Tax=Companilactobacillus kimchiensis TaxID=993692 RepID=A0A0R2LMX0_9LACO|nr:bacteriocin immunity protein [Companilactobacillus kimchiensis]KRO00019.1 hypothetical protein IV57_GL002034 [Companilactobacillus kimchiensis]